MQGINNKKFVENRIKSTNSNRFCVDFSVHQNPVHHTTNGARGQMLIMPVKRYNKLVVLLL